MTGRRVSKSKIKKSIPKSGGLITIIAKASGYAWSSVRDCIRADEELTQMLTDEENRIDDMAENTMIDAIQKGDRGAAQWWLSRRRRLRYGDNLDLTSGGEKIDITIRYADDAEIPNETNNTDVAESAPR